VPLAADAGPVPRPPAVPRSLCAAPFRASEAVAAGLLTRRQLEGPTWRRLFPDVYCLASLALDHRAWCFAAGLLLGDRAGAVSGRSAAYLWGADVLPRNAPVELTVPDEVRLAAVPGLTVVRSWLPACDLASLARTPVTVPLRTGFDLGRRLCRVDAVAAVDALLRRRLCTPRELARFSADLVGWPGARQLAEVLALADAGAESPMESRIRLVLIDGGLPRPVTQFEIFDANGLFVARVDLAYPEQRVAVEYEGDHHRGRGVFAADLRRINAIRTLGWTVLRFGADDVLRHPGRIVAQVRAILAR
jgi:hypothetical protein